jgi:hypothetical protein
VYFTQPFLTNKIRLDQMQGDINAIAFKVLFFSKLILHSL